MASLWDLPQGQGQLSQPETRSPMKPSGIAISAIERASHRHQAAVRAAPDHSDLAPAGQAQQVAWRRRSAGILRRLSGGFYGKVDPALVLVAADLCGNEAGRDTGAESGVVRCDRGVDVAGYDEQERARGRLKLRL